MSNNTEAIPNLTESIAKINQRLVAMDERLAMEERKLAMEERRFETEVMAIEEKRSAGMQNLFAAIGKLTGAIENLRASMDPHGQPIELGTFMPANPTPINKPLPLESTTIAPLINHSVYSEKETLPDDSIVESNLLSDFIVHPTTENVEISEEADASIGSATQGRLQTVIISDHYYFSSKVAPVSGNGGRSRSYVIYNILKLCLPSVCENASMTWACVDIDANFVKPPWKPPDVGLIHDSRNEVCVSYCLRVDSFLQLENPVKGIFAGNIFVSGVVEKVTKKSFVVSVKTKEYFMGSILTEPLSDHRGLADLMKLALKPGHVFDKLLVLDMEGNNLVLTAKHSLIKSGSKLPSEHTEIHSNFVLHGYICNIIETGCFVRFRGHLTGSAPKRKVVEDQKVALSGVFHVGQSVRGNILDVAGDRAGYDDLAIVTGIGTIDGKRYMFIGHQKGRNTKENIRHNVGMPTPQGYWKALCMMYYADHHGFPIVTFINTPRAYVDFKSEEHGQGEAIAH